MRIKHKKRWLGGVSICLLLLFFWESGQVFWQQRAVSSAEAEAEVEVKKIALTFDDGPHPAYT
ncbi:MAG: peptidoglycan N-acetylglucosamine deacetylase, partial [Lachnospiraceae bacterium]|nr:peptidoglycan N-acetylglucosamine deacetylase [Lachnospiraceae bacterium]